MIFDNPEFSKLGPICQDCEFLVVSEGYWYCIPFRKVGSELMGTLDCRAFLRRMPWKVETNYSINAAKERARLRAIKAHLNRLYKEGII